MAHRGELGDTAGNAFTVRPRAWPPWLIVMLVLGLAGTVVAGIASFVSETHPPALAMALGASLVLTAVAVVSAIWRRQLGCQIALYEKGIELKGRSGSTAVAFNEIAALGLTTKDEFANGSFSGLSRRLQLWRQQDPVKRPCVDLLTFCKTGSPEEEQLSEVIDRLIDEAVVRVEQVVASGGIAKGVGVQLSQTTLRVGAEAVPLDRITAAGLHDGRLCLWLDADAEPRYRLDPNLPNVLPIVRIVQKRIEARTAGSEAAVAGLGRILFERRSSRGAAVLVLLLGLVTIWLGVGILLLLWGWHLWVFCFRCHERGVYRRGLFARRELLYRDVASFTFSATRQYYNGAYVGTAISMKFIPEASAGVKPLTFTRSIRNADRDLDELREHVARVVGARLLTVVEKGGSVNWGADAVITPAVLRYRPAKFIGKGEWTELPYQDVAGTSMNQGVLAVFAKDKPKPVLSMPVSVANFFPGYAVFCHLAAKANPAPA